MAGVFPNAPAVVGAVGQAQAIASTLTTTAPNFRESIFAVAQDGTPVVTMMTMDDRPTFNRQKVTLKGWQDRRAAAIRDYPTRIIVDRGVYVAQHKWGAANLAYGNSDFDPNTGYPNTVAPVMMEIDRFDAHLNWTGTKGGYNVTGYNPNADLYGTDTVYRGSRGFDLIIAISSQSLPVALPTIANWAEVKEHTNITNERLNKLVTGGTDGPSTRPLQVQAGQKATAEYRTFLDTEKFDEDELFELLRAHPSVFIIGEWKVNQSWLDNTNAFTQTPLHFDREGAHRFEAKGSSLPTTNAYFWVFQRYKPQNQSVKCNDMTTALKALAQAYPVKVIGPTGKVSESNATFAIGATTSDLAQLTVGHEQPIDWKAMAAALDFRETTTTQQALENIEGFYDMDLSLRFRFKDMTDEAWQFWMSRNMSDLAR